MPLKQKLIKALTPLSELSPARFAAIRHALEAVNIPDDHYKQVITFIILLVKEMPDIVNRPQIKKLSALSKECDTHLKSTEELRTKSRPGKRN